MIQKNKIFDKIDDKLNKQIDKLIVNDKQK